MANITEKEALQIVTLAAMKLELRIPATESEHDSLLTGQITAAANFVMRSTGLAVADLMPLRMAIIAAVRAQYDGAQEVKETAAHSAWMDPFRSYGAG